MFNKLLDYALIPLVRLFYKLLYRAKAYGVENVPMKSNFILAGNHKDFNDPVILSVFLPRRMSYLAKAELFKNGLAKWFFKQIDAIPVTRDATELSMFKAIINLLKQGKIITIFPEGTRTQVKTDNVKPGAVSFALKAQVPILPVFISGKYLPFRSKIRVIFGKPIEYSEYYGKTVPTEQKLELTRKLMDTVYSLEQNIPNK